MAIRFSGSSSEVLRVFNRAVDLLASSAPESDQELLEMVRKAKKEQESNIFHPPKKLRTARAAGDSDSTAPAATATAAASKLGASSRPSDQQQASNQPPKPSGLVRLGSNAGVARGRVEKPKRKPGR